MKASDLYANADGWRERREPELLTEAELKVFAAVEDLLERGWAPTVAEVAAEIKWRSRGSTAQYLNRLKKRGLLLGSGRELRLGPAARRRRA